MQNNNIEPKQVNKILEALSESNVEELVIENDKIVLHVIRDMNVCPTAIKAQKTIPEDMKTESEGKVQKEKKENLPEAKESIYLDILSPEVGIFLRSVKDKGQILVKLRDEVKKGQTLAYVRATGIMYEIKSEHNGKITEILVEDGQAVEFAQPLFRLK